MINVILTDLNIKQLEAHCSSHSVKNMWLFGSAVDSQKFNDQSDLDFIVEFDSIPVLEYADNFFELKEKLETAFNRHVDLVTNTCLTNPYFISEVNRTKKLVFSK